MTTDTTSSLLVRERPDLWRRTIALATRITGYEYAPKMPLPDGTIHACGYIDRSPEAEERRRREHLREQIKRIDNAIRDLEWEIEDEGHDPRELDEKKKQIADLKRQREEAEKSLKAAPRVFVPEGAMEWLLHEVGHWVASTPEERALPNYGLTDDIAGTVGSFQKIIVPSDHRADREWQAWSFEEIVLAPFGPSRTFAPPTQRDGVAFAKSGPLPAWALAHADRQTRAARIDIEEWRALYGEWIRFERGLCVPSWERTN